MNWIYVTRHFTAFLANLRLTDTERADALTKASNLAQCLHNKYRHQLPFHSEECLLVGSFGKGTAIRPPSDLDMLYLLPNEDHHRICQRMGNVQSTLLQEVKECLKVKFPRTDLRADGQVVQVPFETYAIELVPCWKCVDGTYKTPDTNNGGSWRWSNPYLEGGAIYTADLISSGKASHLIQMLKAWKRNCSLELSSLILELLAVEFVTQWRYRNESVLWYDWMIRDFFSWMYFQRDRTLPIPGSRNTIAVGCDWLPRALDALKAALAACLHEYNNYNCLSVDEWQKIFGGQFLPTYDF